jgi:hypothetical protein
MLRKSKQSRAPCLCGCHSKSSSTIAAHRQYVGKQAKFDLLNTARFISGHPGPTALHPVSSKCLSRQKRASPIQPTEDAAQAAEDPMDIDPPVDGPGPSKLLSPLTHVWADRADRRGREDEDLLPEPGPPELSEDEDSGNEEGRDADEADFLTDDEVTARDGDAPVHVEITARDQLTAEFQLHAARAGMFLNMVPFIENVPHPWFSPGESGSRRP